MEIRSVSLVMSVLALLCAAVLLVMGLNTFALMPGGSGALFAYLAYTRSTATQAGQRLPKFLIAIAALICGLAVIRGMS